MEKNSVATFSQLFMIKLYLKHHLGGGKAAFGFSQIGYIATVKGENNSPLSYLILF